MSTEADRRAAFAHLYPGKRPNVWERRWLAGQGDAPAIPDELRTYLAVTERKRNDAALRAGGEADMERERAEARRVESGT